jgi:hypothetical protein
VLGGAMARLRSVLPIGEAFRRGRLTRTMRPIDLIGRKAEDLTGDC